MGGLLCLIPVVGLLPAVAGALINAQDAFALVAATAILVRELRGRYVRYITDKATVYWAWETLSSDSPLVLASVRMAAWLAIRYKFQVVCWLDWYHRQSVGRRAFAIAVGFD